MESEIRIDINQALDQLANKLGVASEEMLTFYTKRAFINGAVWVPASLLFAILPWLSYLVTVPPEWGDAAILCRILRAISCIGFSWAGGYSAFDSIEKLYVPRAIAISSLIKDIRGSD